MTTHFISLFLVFASCSNEKGSEAISFASEEVLHRLTQKLTEAEVNDDLGAFIQYYDAQAISMPEYQLTLDGLDEIECFYSGIFKRQNIKSFRRQAHEFIHLGKTIVQSSLSRPGNGRRCEFETLEEVNFVIQSVTSFTV
ncbi:MAG TPA: hypothetical protein VFW11_08155 [Cyclobacteriaceae bacterium]|nr:hypothetical protein [Cyclobacteriaceae bacterium]